MAVTVIFKKDDKKHFLSVKAQGHAFFSEHGTDIVCSAVSALLQTLLLGASRLGISEKQMKISEGNLFFALPPVMDCEDLVKFDFLADTIFAALEEIKKEYPGRIKLLLESSGGHS